MFKEKWASKPKPYKILLILAFMCLIITLSFGVFNQINNTPNDYDYLAKEIQIILFNASIFIIGFIAFKHEMKRLSGIFLMTVSLVVIILIMIRIYEHFIWF